MSEYKYPSLEELREKFKGKEARIDEIFSKLSKKKFEGVTIDEYFYGFKSHYSKIHHVQFGGIVCVEVHKEWKKSDSYHPPENIQSPNYINPEEYSRGFLLISRHGNTTESRFCLS